jgi:hypothetical protein
MYASRARKKLIDIKEMKIERAQSGVQPESPHVNSVMQAQ